MEKNISYKNLYLEIMLLSKLRGQIKWEIFNIKMLKEILMLIWQQLQDV